MAQNLERRTDGGAATQQNREAQPLEQYVQPRASVYENGSAVVIELEMPGVSRDRVEVMVEKDELTITGHREQPETEKYEILHQERIPLNYRRTFILGEAIDSSRIEAKNLNGVLRLTLPKSEGAKPKKITIQ